MWPDDERIVPFPDDPEPGVADLAAALAAAGARARARASDTQPSPTFAADLRSRLVGAAPASGGALAAMPATTPGSGTAPVLDRVRPRVVRRAPLSVGLPRWSVAALAAVVVVAMLGLDGRWLHGGPVEAGVIGATDATLVRDGAAFALAAGVTLHAGDRIVTGPRGSATLALAGGETRLAGGTDVRLDGVDRGLVQLDQRAGRAWHRVAEPVERYVVRTADVTWTATGTAFDLDRRAGPTGGETVRAIGIERDVSIDGPALAVLMREGQVALVTLSRGAPLVGELADATVTDLDDPWLRWNGRRDRVLGFGLGILTAAVDEPDPTPAATPAATPRPAATPSLAPTPDHPSPAPPTDPVASPTPTATPTASPTATPRPTAKPTPAPTPAPTASPTPALASLGLTVTACPGGTAVLDWTKAPAEGFDHYQGLRSTSSSIAPVYPPVAPAVAPDGLYAADRAILRAIDVDLAPGTTYAWRAVAFTSGDQAYAASAVTTAEVKDVQALGALAWTEEADTVVLDWLPYGGPAACFSFAKLVLAQDDTTPSYLEGASAVWASDSPSAATATLEGLAGGTYYARLEILLGTWAGKRLVAHTDVATVVVP